MSAIAALLAGCSQISFSPPAMYSSKAMNELTADLKKISEKYNIEEVRVHEKDKLSNEFGMAVVLMRDSEGEKFEQILYYNIGIPHNDPKPNDYREYYHKGMKKEPNFVNVDDIIKQKDNIEKYVEDAIAQIGEEYYFKSVTDLTFTADDEKDLQIQFKVNVTKKGQSERREGGRMVTDYYELKFTVDTDGNVIYKK